MRLNKYMIEEYRPKPKEISDAQKEMARYWKVKPDEVIYMDVQDEKKTVGKIFLWFRLDNPKYKNTTKTYQIYPKKGIPEVLKKEK